MLYRLPLGAPAHDVIVELAPLSVAPGVDEDDVVAAVVVARVHQYSVQEVSGGVVVDGLALGAGSVGQVLGLRIKVVSSLNKARTETGFVVQCSPAQHFFFRQTGKLFQVGPPKCKC